MRDGFWRRTLPLGVLGGAAIALSGAPLDWHVLGFLGPAFLLANLDRPERGPSGKHGFVAGWLTASVVSAVALYWVVGLLQAFAGFPFLAAAATALLLWAAQGLVWGSAGMFAATLMGRGVPGWCVVPPSLVVASSLTPYLFPWRLAGTQVPWTTWVQTAELGGEPLLDLTIAFVGCGAAEAVRRLFRGERWRTPALVAAVALLLPIAYGLWRLPEVRAAREEAPRLEVGVVQPNVGIQEKRDPDLAFEHLAQLRRMTRALEAAGAELVVWPETAYPFAIRRGRLVDSQGPTRILADGVRGPVLAGAITVGDGGRRYNSAVVVEADGRISGISDKVELLAFGEYTPLWDYLTPLQQRFPRGLTPGERPRVLEAGPARVAVLNCYEDVLAHYAMRVTREGPGLLVNITNDAWFGDTSEPWLHQGMARLRSVETRRDLVRAVNTGVSSHTLATGEDAIRTDTFVEGSFVAHVRLLDTITPWVRFGDWPTPLCAGALLGAAFAVRRRRAPAAL